MKTAFLAIVLALSGAAAGAQTLPGDPQAGRAFALRLCAGCHAVADQQSRPAVDGLPSFAQLARTPALTESSLRVFLQTPHPPMPDIILSRREMDDVISYILNLR